MGGFCFGKSVRVIQYICIDYIKLAYMCNWH
jgi:hypothetical protein